MNKIYLTVFVAIVSLIYAVTPETRNVEYQVPHLESYEDVVTDTVPIPHNETVYEEYTTTGPIYETKYNGWLVGRMSVSGQERIFTISNASGYRTETPNMYVEYDKESTLFYDVTDYSIKNTSVFVGYGPITVNQTVNRTVFTMMQVQKNVTRNRKVMRNETKAVTKVRYQWWSN